MKKQEFKMSWEESVVWYKSQPNNDENILYNYFDDNVLDAANRYYNSIEYAEIKKILFKDNIKYKILEIAAGRGIVSYSFCLDGMDVVTLEPDKSEIVGNGAIKELNKHLINKINIVEAYSEDLPFKDETFDLVFVRQGVHHFYNLDKSLSEIYRVLRISGKLLAIREHVINVKDDLNVFLNAHPLHKLYGGENAYLLEEYIKAFEKANFIKIKIIHPFENEINLFPNSKEKIRINLNKKFGFEIDDKLFEKEIERLNTTVKTPGILYSFFAHKGND